MSFLVGCSIDALMFFFEDFLVVQGFSGCLDFLVVVPLRFGLSWGRPFMELLKNCGMQCSSWFDGW